MFAVIAIKFLSPTIAVFIRSPGSSNFANQNDAENMRVNSKTAVCNYELGHRQ